MTLFKKTIVEYLADNHPGYIVYDNHSSSNIIAIVPVADTLDCWITINTITQLIRSHIRVRQSFDVKEYSPKTLSNRISYTHDDFLQKITDRILYIEDNSIEIKDDDCTCDFGIDPFHE